MIGVLVSHRLPYDVSELTWENVPFPVRWRLRRRWRRRDTGLMLYTITRVAFLNTASRYGRVISIFEGTRSIAYTDTQLSGPKFRAMSPGRHVLRLNINDGKHHADFDHEVRLVPGDIFVAVCRPSFSRKFLDDDPPPERWYLGILRPEDRL